MSARWVVGPHTALRRLLVVGTVMAVAPMVWAYQGISMPTLPASFDSSDSAVLLFGSGTLTTPNPASKAITYNPDLAPIGAAMTASLVPSSDGSTQAELTVFGLLPNRGYAAHAHTRSCGAAGDAAGPRFQNHLDPAATPQAPSTSPRYANPNNEIWLDVRTDSAGAGTSSTRVPFVFTDRAPGSIVVYEAMRTLTAPGHAGEAGARIACLTLAER
ncbi:MAG: superoxide dismutase [Pseudonocardiaceae bacterium]